MCLVPAEAREGIRSHRTRMTGDCGVQHREPNLSSLQPFIILGIIFCSIPPLHKTEEHEVLSSLVCCYQNEFEKLISDPVIAQTSPSSALAVGRSQLRCIGLVLNLTPIFSRFISYLGLHDKSSQKFCGLKLDICSIFLGGEFIQGSTGFSVLSFKTTLKVSGRNRGSMRCDRWSSASKLV